MPRRRLLAFALSLSVTPIAAPAAVVRAVDPGLPTHTVYRPANLAAVTAPLPIVAWANGGCRNENFQYRPFLEAVADRGYFVVAIGPILPNEVETPRPASAPPQEAPKQVGDPQAAPPKTRWQQLSTAIDWAIAENGRVGSPYRGKLDTKHIAVIGQSCGGLQAIKASAEDRRVTASAILHSGVLPGSGGLPGAETTKSDLDHLHAPIAYISGDASDIAFTNANDDYARIKKVPAIRVWKTGVGHSGTYREPSGGAYGPIVISWLDWQLKASTSGRAVFVPEGNCELCRITGWHVEAKGF